MGPTTWLAESRVLVVAGKGGVGKTTVSAAVARAAARSGASVLVVGIDGRQELGHLLGGSEPLGYEPVTIGEHGPGRVEGRLLSPEEALLEYLDDRGMRRVARRFVRTGAVDVLATTTPGIRDLLVLGKIRQIEAARSHDLVVVDAPAAGHAVTFLRAPRAIDEVVSVGPLASQAAEALEFLGDGTRCQVVLVTLAEETPVNELTETAFDLEEDLGLTLGPVVVNACWPERAGLDVDPSEAAEQAGVDLSAADRAALTASARFTAARCHRQRAQVDRLAGRLPLPRIELPRRFTARMGPADVDALADAVVAGPA